MTTRKHQKKAPTDVSQFLAALAEHEAREDLREAERERRIVEQMKVLVEGSMAELRAVVDKVTGYQTAVARAWAGENRRIETLEKKAEEHAERIKALETKCGDDLR